MSRVIDGIRYYTATEVARELGVSRQTIWRWRREARIPPGNRFRDGQVMFAESELQAVREHANRIEPLASKNVSQLNLFNGAFRKKGGGPRSRRGS